MLRTSAPLNGALGAIEKPMFPEDHVNYRYKYLPFSEGSLKALTDGTMKFTSPAEFNDPFDCLPHYDLESIKQIDKVRPDIFRRAARIRGYSPAERIRRRPQLIAELRQRIASGDFVRDLMANIGVVSLSTDALNILMWSHYAEFHRGLVLEFRIPILGYKEDVPLAIDRLLPNPVRYTHQRPHIKMGLEDPQDLVNKCLLTKSVDWEYEKEERVIDHVRGPGIFSYRRNEILSSVIAGLRMTDQNMSRLKSIVVGLSSEMPNLKLYRAEVHTGTFDLYVPGHPSLGKD